MSASDSQKGTKIAAAVLVAAQILAAGGAVAVNLLAAVVLSPAGRGDLAFALQLAYFLSVFAVMGLERPFIASRSGGFGTEYRVFARMVTPGTLCVLPIAFIAAALSPFSTRWMWMGVIAIAAYVALNSLVHALRVAYVCSREWKWFAVNAIVTQLIIVVGAVLLVLIGINDPVVWMWAYAASAVPTAVLLFVAPRPSKHLEPTRTEKRGLRRRGWVLLPSEFSNSAMLRSDRLLLPILSSSAALGLYVTVATVLEMATWPVQQWVDASLRNWSQGFSSHSFPVVRIIARSVLLLVASAAVLAAAAYAMIVIVLPDSYAPAAAAIIPLAVSAVIFGVTRVQQGLLIAADSPGTVSVVEIIGTVASLIAYITLIPHYGMFGAAYGSIIGYAVCAAAGAFTLARVIRRKAKQSYADGPSADVADGGADLSDIAPSAAEPAGSDVELIDRYPDRTRK